MSLNQSERSLRGRIGAELSWANTPNRSARTAPARAAMDQKFLDEAERRPRPRRDTSARRTSPASRSKSAQSRRKAREATATAEQAEAELDAMTDAGDAA